MTIFQTRLSLLLSIFLFFVWGAPLASASNRFLTYQGRITELNGSPLEYEFTQFKFEITNPAGTCVLYRETSNTIDMRNSQGVFDVAIGSGSVDPATPAGNNIESVFRNDTTFNCITGGTYSAADGQNRKLRVSFRDSVGWRLLTSDQEIRGVPFASFAQNAASANRLGTASETDFLKISNIPTCAAGTFLRHVAPTGTLVCEAVGSVSGASISGNISGSAAGFTGSLAGDVTGTQATTSVDRVKGLPVNTAAAADGKVLKYQSGSLVFADDDAGMATIADGSVTDAKIDSITTAGKVSGTAIISGTISGSTAINTSGLIQTNNGIRLYTGSNYVELKASGSPSGDYSLRFPAAAGSNGQVLKVDASGNLYWANDDAGAPAGVTAVSSANSYLTITNGSTTPTITANVGTSANTLAAGDDSRFTDSRTPTGSASGDLSGTYPNPSVAAIRGNAIATGTIPGADIGKVYRWNGTELTPAYLNFGDLRTAGGAQQLTAICAANEKIQWSVITDAFTCQAIGLLDASAITAGTIDAARLPASVKYWEAATGGINYAGGNVGIGTTSPLAGLHIAASAPIPGSGTVSGTMFTTTITGVGTSFTSEFATFDTITINGNSYQVMSVSSDTSLMVNAPITTSFSNASFLRNAPYLKTGPASITSNGIDVKGGDVKVANGSFNLDGSAGGKFWVTSSTDSNGSAPTFIGARSRTAGAPIDGDVIAQFLGQNQYDASTLTDPGLQIIARVNGSDKGAALVFRSKAYGTANSVESMRVEQNGNVGIGVTSPTAKLEVAGVIHSTTGGIKFPDGTTQTTAATGGGSGTVTTVSSGNSYLTITNASTTPTITANVGTSANTLAAGDDSRFTDARTPTGSAGGDLSGTYPNPGVAAIRGNSVASGTIPGADIGKVYRWNGTSLTPAFLNFGDLRTAGGAQQLAAVCAANEKIQWSVITDAFTCQAIGSLDASAITAGTIDAARLPASVKYWEAAAGGISYSGGNVGIGTNAFTGPGSAGSNLKILRTLGNWGLVIQGDSTNQSDILLQTPSNTVDSRVIQFVNSANKLQFRALNDDGTQKMILGSMSLDSGNVTLNTGGGNLGVGTANPLSKLEVAGTIHSTSGGIKFPDGTVQTTAGASSGVAQYDSGWYAMASGTYYVFYHGLGVNPQLIRVLAKDDATGKIIELSPQYAYGYSTYGGLNNVTSDATTIKVSTYNINRLGSFLDGANNPANMEFATSKVRVLAWSSNIPTSIWSQNASATYINGTDVGIGTTNPSAKLEVNGSFKSGNSWAKTTPANTTITSSGTLSSFSFTCNGGPILIFGNLSVANTAGSWNSIVAYIREGSPTGTVIRSISGTSNNGPTVGLFSTTVQTLHNCSAGAKTFYLTLDTNPGVTIQAQNIEFSAAELGIKSP